MDKILEFLNQREERVLKINRLKEEFKMPCIFLRVNYPGIDKCNEVTSNILNVIKSHLIEKFKGKIEYKESGQTLEGPYALFIINDEVDYIKRKTVDIENNHILGRLVDIDVYEILKEEAISRGSIGFSKRKCYLCDNYAHLCVRDKVHSKEEIISFINDKWREYSNAQNR